MNVDIKDLKIVTNFLNHQANILTLTQLEKKEC
jgi:hypothetical protein